MTNARLVADLVLISHRNAVPHVLLIKRGREPFEGMWALPGGHLDDGEEAEAAAIRELGEETGVTAAEVHLVGVYGSPGRDPRGRYVT